jgi:hypothetical protein
LQWTSSIRSPTIVSASQIMIGMKPGTETDTISVWASNSAGTLTSGTQPVSLRTDASSGIP